MILDLNADVGEGAGTDAELMPWITSANVCCGMHAGDAETIWNTLMSAKANGVVCGAHPGFEDRANFGRTVLWQSRFKAFVTVLHQIGALSRLAFELGLGVRYVKPHGALYHTALGHGSTAQGIFEALKALGGLPFVGLPNEETESRARHDGIPYIREGFADRRYLPDGSLVPRTEPNAVLHDPKEVVEQVEWLVREKAVQTICVHGDTPGAVEFVQKVRESLLAKGHIIRAFAE